MRSPARVRSPERKQYNLYRRRGREDVAMPGSARMGDSFGRTVLLVVLLALLCTACNRTKEERGQSGNDIGPIATEQGEKAEDTAGTDGASVKWVEVSTLVTDLE